MFDYNRCSNKGQLFCPTRSVKLPWSYVANYIKKVIRISKHESHVSTRKKICCSQKKQKELLKFLEGFFFL